jgi:hypothetical protein
MIGERQILDAARADHGVARQGGLTRFRRAAETPFNLILEARA